MDLPFPSSLQLIDEGMVEKGVKIDVGRTDRTCGCHMRLGRDSEGLEWERIQAIGDCVCLQLDIDALEAREPASPLQATPRLWPSETP